MDTTTLLHHLTRFLISNEDLLLSSDTNIALSRARSYVAALKSTEWTKSFTKDTPS